MNELVVPPAPHWYKSSIVACAPDNTLVYGSKNDLVVVTEKVDKKPADVRIIHGAHSKHVTSVDLNRKWKDPHSYAVSLGEDSVIRVWNLDTFEKKTSNKDHVGHKEAVIGAVFAGDDRVVSATSSGVVSVWNINTNESKFLKDLFKNKVTLTCLSSCPHAGWLLAFGLSNGGVVVADLRRNGQVLYKLRGHYQSVVSLSWCPAPVNVFPQSTNNTVKNKSTEDVPETTSVENNTKEKKINPWVNLVHADDDAPVVEGQKEVPDFLKECDNLRNKILGVETQKNDDEKVTVAQDDRSDKAATRAEKPRQRQEVVQNRPLPVIFDGDFLDDSGLDSVALPEEKQKIEQEKSDLQEKTEEPEIETSGEDSGIMRDAYLKPEEPIEEEPRTEYLLASAGRDKSVYIWRAGTDGRMQTFFFASRKSNRREKHSMTWIALCWVTPDTILTSSATGEILAWSMPKPKDAKKHFTVVHYEHSCLVFNIVTPPNYRTAYNWRDKVAMNAWTWGQEGKLVNYDLSKEKIRCSFTTVTALVTCFSSSVLDPNRLAIGLRDGGIRVWDLSIPHSNVVNMQRYHPKYTQRVSAIAWHPVRETIVAFGTEEGRVGFIDLTSKKHTLFPHYFRNQVYKVEWGPVRGDVDNLGLYVVAEGKMAIYNIDKPTENPTHMELPENLNVYRFAWKPDHTLLLLNGKDGSLVVLKTDLTAITTIYPNDKGLNGIVWHPDAFTNKTEISPRCNWFAAATTKGVIVFDCHALDKNDNFADKLVVSFEGHLKPPLALAWCPFEGNKIISTAGDGLSHVWDVTTKTIIATFVDSYLSHNYAAAWSPVDPDLVIIGDKTLRIWSISGNPPRSDEEFIAERKRMLAKSAKNDPEKTEKNKIKVEIPVKVKSAPKNYIVPSIYVSNDDNISQQVDRMRKLMDGGGDISSEKTKLDPFDLFGNKEQVSTLLDANYQQHQKEGKFKSCELISLWKGNVAEHIQNAINENRVTPSVIALAPMVSIKLWQDACVIYAKKLSEEANSDPLETAMYFLACHKVEDAIHSLCLNLMFREALALAKHRLSENSDITTNVVEKWAQHCTDTGNFENAAYCYISINDYEKAAKVLARRTHKEFLEFALELAEKAGNKGLCDSIKYKCSEAQSAQIAEPSVPSRGDAILKNMAENESQIEEDTTKIEKEE